MTPVEWAAGASERERDLAREATNARRTELGLPPLPEKTPQEQLDRDLDAIWGPT
jgi:hypothetical protein